MPGDRGGSECTITKPANVGQYDLSLPHMETERRAEPETNKKRQGEGELEKHGGDQFVALLMWYGSSGFFDSGLQLICIFWSLSCFSFMGFRSGEFAG